MEFAKTLHDIFYLYINIRVMHKLNTIKYVYMCISVRMNRENESVRISGREYEQP